MRHAYGVMIEVAFSELNFTAKVLSNQQTSPYFFVHILQRKGRPAGTGFFLNTLISLNTLDFNDNIVSAL